jgi:hypothetical protein
VDVTRRHRHGLDAHRMAGIRDVHRIFGEDHRVVIGEGDALAAVCQGSLGDGFRLSSVGQRIHFARLGNVPVLAELAGEVAACGAKGKDRRTRVEMIERLLLYRIDAEAGGAAVGGEHHGVAFAHAHKAGAALALVQPAVAWAEVTLHAAVVEHVPPTPKVVLNHGIPLSSNAVQMHLTRGGAKR